MAFKVIVGFLLVSAAVASLAAPNHKLDKKHPDVHVSVENSTIITNLDATLTYLENGQEVVKDLFFTDSLRVVSRSPQGVRFTNLTMVVGDIRLEMELWTEPRDISKMHLGPVTVYLLNLYRPCILEGLRELNGKNVIYLEPEIYECVSRKSDTDATIGARLKVNLFKYKVIDEVIGYDGKIYYTN